MVLGGNSPSSADLAERFVRGELESDPCVDSSHDWWHIHRVRNLALALAREEGLPGSSMEVVELAALLHDVKDWKYSKDADAGAKAVQEFLDASTSLPQADKDHVVSIVRTIGFKDELDTGGAAAEPSLEFRVVQDADRLDAIGAIGIARCLTFGGRRGRVLHDPSIPPREALSKEEYMSSATARQTTINHFHEKLLKLKGMMKSEAGRRRAEARHRHMELYLEQFYAE